MMGGVEGLSAGQEGATGSETTARAVCDGAISKQQSEYWQQEVVLVMCISVQFPEERDI